MSAVKKILEYDFNAKDGPRIRVQKRSGGRPYVVRTWQNENYFTEEEFGEWVRGLEALAGEG